MIRYLLLFGIFLLTGHIYGQDDGQINGFANNCKLGLSDTVIYFIVDTMPQFPGGEESLYKFIAANLTYPKGDPNYMGTELVDFVVEIDGRLTNIAPYPLEAIGSEEAFKEAMNVVSKMPKWIAGKCSGRKVRVFFTLPISFKH